MKLLMVTIKDRAVEAFQPITCVRAPGEAIRAFLDAINNPQNKQLHEHPDDFDLYSLGTFDDQTGEIQLLERPEKIADGKQLTQSA